jgi:lysophospholipase L1-like esterase
MTSISTTLATSINSVRPRKRAISFLRTFAVIALMVLAVLVANRILHIKYVIATGLKGEFGPATAQWQAEVTQQARRSQQIQGSAVFIGDSLTVGFATSNVTAKAENFGIDGDSIDWLLLRMPRYRLNRASVIVVEIGINNLLQRGQSGFDGFAAKYHRLLAMLPAQVPAIAMGILPVNTRSDGLLAGRLFRTTLRNVNREIAAECKQFPNCRYLDLSATLADASGNLDDPYDAGDGVHLSTAGYEVWRTMLTPLLDQMTALPHVEDLAQTHFDKN